MYEYTLTESEIEQLLEQDRKNKEEREKNEICNRTRKP